MSKKPENLNTIRQSCGSRVVVNGVSCISPIIEREMYDSSLLYSAAKNKHAKESLVWKPMSEDWKKTAGTNFGSRIQSKKRSDYTRRWTDACLLLKNACFLLQEKRCACQPMNLIWKTY